MKRGSSKDMYAEAYAAHYKQKDLEIAYNLYLEVIDAYPGSSECKYAKTQIENIKKASPDCCVPSEENRAVAARHDAAIAEAKAAEREKYAANRHSAEPREQKNANTAFHDVLDAFNDEDGKIAMGFGQYRVMQVVLREKFVGKGSKNFKEIEDLCNQQYAEGYRLHTFAQSTAHSTGALGGDRTVCNLVFERMN